MNSSLRGILPIMKEEGVNPTSFISNAFKNLGIRTDGTVLGQMKASVALPGKMNLGIDAGSGYRGPVPHAVIEPGAGLTVAVKGQDINASLPPQLDPNVGDQQSLEETKTMLDRKAQDYKVFEQLAKEHPNDPKAQDAFDKANAEYFDR